MDKRTIFEIHKLHDMGLKERFIARRLRLSRPTVRKYLANPDITRTKKPDRPGKLSDYYEFIQQLLTDWPAASAAVILQRIREKGYTGGITILRSYLQATRGKHKHPKAYIRFESRPGEQMQFDWGHFGALVYNKTIRKLYCMAVLECHSRMLYLEFTHSQSKESVMRTLLHAFIYFGGTPIELVHDNLKTAVIERIDTIIRFNEDYLHFLRPFHIRPYACALADASAKGKIEKGGIHYIRYNFWPCRTFTDLDDVNRQAARWRDQIANARIHATTNEVPLQRFQPDALRPLPEGLPDVRDTSTGKIHTDCRFRFDGNAYSAPNWNVGDTISIKADNHLVQASIKDKIIAEHPRSWERRAVIENPNHIKELLLTREKARKTRQQQLLLSMGEPVEQFLQGLATAGKSLSNAASRLLALRDQYGTLAVRTALESAIHYKAFGVEYVENILMQNAKPASDYAPVVLQNPSLNQMQLQEPDLYLYDAITLKKRSRCHD